MTLPTTITPVILAGGLGTRLRSIVADVPKPLAPINGQPFITFILTLLAQQRFPEIIISTGYLAEKFPELLGDRFGPMKLHFIAETEPRGTGGALKHIANSVKSPWLLVCNGDSFCDLDLNQFIAQALERKSPLAMALTEVSNVERYGKVVCSSDGTILSFEEKQAGGGSGLVNAGIYLISRDALLGLTLPTPFSLEREAFPSWLGRNMFGYITPPGRFIDIGTPASFAAASQVLAAG